jgi:hypothetical protein
VNFEQRPISHHPQVNQIENENTATTESNFPQNKRGQFNDKTFDRGGFNSRGPPRGGRGGGRKPLRLEDMFCVVHGKGARHTSKMCPKVKKSIKEVQQENRTTSQSKVVNHVIQENTNQTYYPIHYGHSQAMLPGPPPLCNYEPIAMYHPMQSQWRQTQPQQSSTPQYNQRLRLQITTIKTINPSKEMIPPQHQ